MSRKSELEEELAKTKALVSELNVRREQDSRDWNMYYGQTVGKILQIAGMPVPEDWRDWGKADAIEATAKDLEAFVEGTHAASKAAAQAVASAAVAEQRLTEVVAQLRAQTDRNEELNTKLLTIQKVLNG